mgnify:CR=1 FL=1
MVDDCIVADESAWKRLLSCRGIGLSMAKRLVGSFGSAAAAVSADAGRLERIAGVSERTAKALHREIARSRLDEEEGWLVRNGGRHIVFGFSGYPSLLCPTPDPPPMLRCRGSLPPEGAPCVAIVGTRSATAYGLRQAARITAGLIERGFSVVSGGARGIDAEVHRTAIRFGGRTIVVLGSGLACPYPSEHAGMFEQVIAHGGAILSEVSVHQSPRPGLFPRRNRIISGISHAVVMVEAPCRSGAMVTARLAVEEHGRDAMAVPGAADSHMSAGCHMAIRNGWAQLVTSSEDVVEALRGDYTASRSMAQ